MAEIACTYVEDLLQKRKLRKDVQQVLLAEIPPMEREMQISLGRRFTVKELIRGIRLMGEDRAAGPDRTISEFFQAHARLWARLFLLVFNESRRRGTLPEYMLHRDIAFLFKKGDPRRLPRLLTMYRGLSLLQRPFLLLSTVLAYRMRRPASLICDSTQKAFRPGPLIGDNLSSIVDMFCYVQHSGQAGYAVAGDAIKYYDLIDPEFALDCVAAGTSCLID